MSHSRTLSIAPYYGGKGRIAHFLTDRFDYTNTSVYVSAFGGMCRDLLNKPRHRFEIYNDYNVGLCTLMQTLSDSKTAEKMISRLYRETDFSKDCFDEYKEIYDRAEMDLLDWEKAQLIKYVQGQLQKPSDGKRDTRKIIAAKIVERVIEDGFDLSTNNTDIQKEKLTAYDEFKESARKNKKIAEKVQVHLDNIKLLIDTKERDGVLPRRRDLDYSFDDIKLAMATFIVFTMSFYGQGEDYNKHRFKSPDEYKQHVLRLYECAERMEGVLVTNTDTMSFFANTLFDEEAKKIISGWLLARDVMMYCDPSYISPDDEKKLLEGINPEKVPSLSDAIKEKHGNQLPENLGRVYSRSFGYREQEFFLQNIQHANCKLMVSNYDLALYNKYLNEKTGWQRREIETFTSIGGKAGNTRKEVIWFNY